MRILEKEECERLGAYKNEKSNKIVKVNFECELCAARVSSKMPPEKWIKVRSDLEDDEKGEEIAYKKAKEDDIPPPKTFFYGGVLLYYFSLYQ